MRRHPIRVPARAGLAAGLLVAVVALASCGTGAGTLGRERLPVVATTSQVGDAVLNVGGGDLDLTVLSGPGADPHAYRPTQRELEALRRAKVVFASGAGLDRWVRAAMARAGARAPVVDLAAATTLRQESGTLDPHWWMDPTNMEAAVTKIRDALTQADPGQGAIYRRTALAYTERLRQLDAQLGRCFARVPEQRRAIGAAHDAFGYLAARYGLRSAGGTVPATEGGESASARAVDALARRMRAAGADVVLVDGDRRRELGRRIAEATGARVVPGAYADALGQPGSDASTYLSAMATAASRIVRGLTGGRTGCVVRIDR